MCVCAAGFIERKRSLLWGEKNRECDGTLPLEEIQTLNKQADEQTRSYPSRECERGNVTQSRLELTDNTHQSRCCGLQDCFKSFFISTPMLCSGGALVMQDWLTTSQLISWLTDTNEKILRISSEQLLSFFNYLKCYILESWIVGFESDALPVSPPVLSTLWVRSFPPCFDIIPATSSLPLNVTTIIMKVKLLWDFLKAWRQRVNHRLQKCSKSILWFGIHH